MRYTIITPTLQRQSLIRTCQSIEQQTFKDWQHLVVADCSALDPIMLRAICHPQRRTWLCPTVHHNYGNSCRHQAWILADGEYLLYLDDDNYLADEQVLADIDKVLKDDFAVFPILRHGQVFFSDRPRCCHADTANIVVRREIGRWPDIPEYTADGIWIDALVKKHRYQIFPEFRPIVVMPKSSEGR